MSYNLRPGRKLKRPARYQSQNGDESEGSPISANHVTVTHAKVHSLSPSQPFSAVAPQTPNPSPLAPRPTAPFIPAAHDTLATPRTVLNASSASVPHRRRNMPNVRYVRKYSQRPLADEHHDKDRDDTLPVRRPIGRPPTRPLRHVPTSIYPGVKPASFPSLASDEPPSQDTSKDGVHYGAWELMKAMEKSDQKGIHTSKRGVDDMYNNEKFPLRVTEEEKMWYADLAERWRPNDPEVQVAFASLWPSLRQSIIEQIRDDFPPGTYYDSYHPVQCLLGLSQSALKIILDENSAMWTVEDNVPKYLRDYKKLHPDKIIDPDAPPPREVVKAIKFLKQAHLPGSLLGEWQFPLPSIEVFRPPPIYSIPLRVTGSLGGGSWSKAWIETNRLPKNNRSNPALSTTSAIASRAKLAPLDGPTTPVWPNSSYNSGWLPITENKKRKRGQNEEDIAQERRYHDWQASTFAAAAKRYSQRHSVVHQRTSSSQYEKLRVPIRTVDQLQERNRAHPGLRSLGFTNITKGLRDSHHHHTVMAGKQYDERLATPGVGPRYPLPLPVSAAAYAQTTTVNLLAAREENQARRLDVPNYQTYGLGHVANAQPPALMGPPAPRGITSNPTPTTAHSIGAQENGTVIVASSQHASALLRQRTESSAAQEQAQGQ
ncbi:uncharacterized protein K460DRAFT_350683 [Cucurbitaria berberidis CBS 394.84]|uniref:Uncharacterized protein n=1 Tax=Cucurbitaria berberidis CBS 394.84 TaxID=1168544 RepID=A0A9P4LE09_9PLEO|nr:uncharacterized protein K460DRAFT_350683 [Cucurbitaria berberidis CBS 394.84]KAF1850654.1 hypothetical protein K460DRAFT_350683 [Cucurbitaria berberidis CBS 394.84]